MHHYHPTSANHTVKRPVLIRIIGLVMVVVIYVKGIVIRMIMMLMVVSVLMVQMVLQSCMRVLMTVVRILHLDWARIIAVQPQLER